MLLVVQAEEVIITFGIQEWQFSEAAELATVAIVDPDIYRALIKDRVEPDPVDARVSTRVVHGCLEVLLDEGLEGQLCFCLPSHHVISFSKVEAVRGVWDFV